MIEAMLTMRPPRPAIMCRAALRAQRNTPVMLTSMTLSQSARSSSTLGLRIAVPALLNLDAAEGLGDLGEGSVDRGLVGNVQRNGQALAALIANRRGDGLGCGEIEIGDGDPRPGLGQAERHGPADAPRGAGDDSRLTVEPELVQHAPRHAHALHGHQ